MRHKIAGFDCQVQADPARMVSLECGMLVRGSGEVSLSESAVGEGGDIRWRRCLSTPERFAVAAVSSSVRKLAADDELTMRDWTIKIRKTHS